MGFFKGSMRGKWISVKQNIRSQGRHYFFDILYAVVSEEHLTTLSVRRRIYRAAICQPSKNNSWIPDQIFMNFYSGVIPLEELSNVNVTGTQTRDLGRRFQPLFQYPWPSVRTDDVIAYDDLSTHLYVTQYWLENFYEIWYERYAIKSTVSHTDMTDAPPWIRNKWPPPAVSIFAPKMYFNINVSSALCLASGRFVLIYPLLKFVLKLIFLEI